MELETPPSFMEKSILNFHFDYWNTSLRHILLPFLEHSGDMAIWAWEKMLDGVNGYPLDFSFKL